MSDRTPPDPQDEDRLAAQRFLRQVIDLNPSFIFAKDRAGRFTLVNQAVADNYGTTVEELIGKTDADFNPDAAQVEHFRSDDLEVMDTRREKVVPAEVITDSTGQRRWLHTIKRPIIGPDGRADQVLGVSTDITDVRRLEDQLAQAQKMEAVGRLAGGVAHDFNNLLTVVLGSVDMLLDTLEPGHPGQPHAEEIRRAGERAAMLTRQLLAFSRRQLLQPEVLDLNRIVADGARMLRHLIGEDLELVVLTEAPDARVRGDATQVTQVILNLAINARDAMPHGGTLTLRTFLSGAEAAGGGAPGGYVTIAVGDTGHGIPPEALPHIFEPFFTTKPVGMGTGLGLATSYGIVEQSGGHITFTTAVGEGTTFLVHLPRAADGDGPERAAPAPVAGGAETVLVVEDEGMVRAVASASLRAKGYHVLEASNGSEALAIAAGHDGPIHLLVTDVVMPQMGGVELTGQLVRQRPDTRVLYVSGYTDEPRALRTAQGLAGNFLPKPYVGESLAREVRRILDAPPA